MSNKEKQEAELAVGLPGAILIAGWLNDGPAWALVVGTVMVLVALVIVATEKHSTL